MTASHSAILSLHRPTSGGLQRAISWLAAAMMILAAVAAFATPPPAGTAITNQASATYTDSSGLSHSVTSNVVQTTVQQV